jgi:hypothetical protein
MTNQTPTNLHQEKPQPPQQINPYSNPFPALNNTIIIICILLTLGWVINQIVSSRYSGSFHFRDKSGINISAKLTPPDNDHTHNNND